MSRKIRIHMVVSFLLAILVFQNVLNGVAALPVTNIRLIVDGEDITALAGPIIENGRTLAPLRFVSEKIGAAVDWDGVNGTVRVEMGNKGVFLWIGSHLVEYNRGEIYQLCDVMPKIINGRTYVPLRLISNALGIGIRWDESTRTIFVDSQKTSFIEPFFDIKITSLKARDTISGRTNLQVAIPVSYQTRAKEVKVLLLDKDTARGFVVASGKILNSTLDYLPKVEDKGEKILVAAVYDENRKFIGGDSIPVSIDINPQVTLTGIAEAGIIKGTVGISQNLNFLAQYVKYELTSFENGKVTTLDQQDPQGTYAWTPTLEQNGSYAIKVIAYGSDGMSYESSSLNVTVAVERKLALSGVSSGMTVNKPVTLMAARNFDVSETQFIIKDVNTGLEDTLATIPYGGYEWFPGPQYTGDKELRVRVKDVAGMVHESNPVRVKADGSPKVLIQGIGPKQVLTGEQTLSVKSNVLLDSVNYTLTNPITGTTRVLGANLPPNEGYRFIPLLKDAGDRTIQAEGMYQGNKILSAKIPFKIYLGTLYGPKAVIERDKFLSFVSPLAQESWQKTGMSTALQMAQAILETGWGQSVPVDKYSGKFSYNLFGIKGTGINGSVTSNTWEVYNGISYRVDAEFRAYNAVGESWEDHKRLLLTADRYEPFRDVMYDSTLGAWAIRRAGYATDPLYPIKLMNIIKLYGLQKSDLVGIGS